MPSQPFPPGPRVPGVQYVSVVETVVQTIVPDPVVRTSIITTVQVSTLAQAAAREVVAIVGWPPDAAKAYLGLFGAGGLAGFALALSVPYLRTTSDIQGHIGVLAALEIGGCSRSCGEIQQVQSGRLAYLNQKFSWVCL
jgi:hypothetical protein